MAVNMVPAFPVELFDGWELVPVDPACDDKAPIYYPDRIPFSPRRTTSRTVQGHPEAQR